MTRSAAPSLDDGLAARLGVGEEHHGLVGVVEEGVVHAGEAGAEGPLYKDDALGSLDVEDGHAAYGAVLLLVVGGGVHDVVGAHDYGGVGVFELGVYVLEVVELVVGDARLRAGGGYGAPRA